MSRDTPIQVHPSNTQCLEPLLSRFHPSNMQCPETLLSKSHPSNIKCPKPLLSRFHPSNMHCPEPHLSKFHPSNMQCPEPLLSKFHPSNMQYYPSEHRGSSAFQLFNWAAEIQMSVSTPIILLFMLFLSLSRQMPTQYHKLRNSHFCSHTLKFIILQ